MSASPDPESAEALTAGALDALRARVGAAVARLPQASETTRRLSAEAERAIGDLSVSFGRVEAALSRLDLAANIRALDRAS